MIGFPPIFVADTKIIYGYNFVAPLKMKAVSFQCFYLYLNQTCYLVFWAPFLRERTGNQVKLRARKIVRIEVHLSRPGVLCMYLYTKVYNQLLTPNDFIFISLLKTFHGLCHPVFYLMFPWCLLRFARVTFNPFNYSQRFGFPDSSAHHSQKRRKESSASVTMTISTELCVYMLIDMLKKESN